MGYPQTLPRTAPDSGAPASMLFETGEHFSGGQVESQSQNAKYGQGSLPCLCYASVCWCVSLHAGWTGVCEAVREQQATIGCLAEEQVGGGRKRRGKEADRKQSIVLVEGAILSLLVDMRASSRGCGDGGGDEGCVFEEPHRGRAAPCRVLDPNVIFK